MATLDGDELRLSDALVEGPVVLVFLPGLWSPNARRQLAELDLMAEAFAEDGVGLIAVITEDLQRIASRLGANAPKFPLLADHRRDAARDFGVFRAVSRDGIGVTRPSVFLIDQSGTLRFAYVGDGERDIVESQTLHQLSRGLLASAKPATGASVTAESLVVDGVGGDEPELDLDVQLTPVDPILNDGEGVVSTIVEDQALLAADDQADPDIAATTPSAANEAQDDGGSSPIVDEVTAAAAEDRVVK
ncbi:MAG: hypothetical protein HW416_771 [Chloroflexi bacterium]|nr:hypothetical protein [Chloroflexota bacterium]